MADDYTDFTVEQDGGVGLNAQNIGSGTGSNFQHKKSGVVLSVFFSLICSVLSSYFEGNISANLVQPPFYLQPQPMAQPYCGACVSPLPKCSNPFCRHKPQCAANCFCYRIAWTDKVFVMEQKHKNRLSAQFPRALRHKEIIVLDIPDDYRYMDEDLIGILKEVSNIICPNSKYVQNKRPSEIRNMVLTSLKLRFQTAFCCGIKKTCPP